MANPFLVLGGVAVGVITAGIGVLQVPGWIDSANDSAARNDLGQIALAEEASYTVAAKYLTEADLVSGRITGGPSAGETTGVKIQQSDGVQTAVFLSPNTSRWAALSMSKSGHVFLRTSDSTTVYSSEEKYDATTPLSSLKFLAPGSSTPITINATSGAVAGVGVTFTMSGTPAASRTLGNALGTGTGAGAGVTIANAAP